MATTSSGFIKQMALLEWSQKEKTEKGWQAIVELLLKDKNRNWTWTKIANQVLEKNKDLKYSKISTQLADLKSSIDLNNQHESKVEKNTGYKKSLRLPASEDVK